MTGDEHEHDKYYDKSKNGLKTNNYGGYPKMT